MQNTTQIVQTTLRTILSEVCHQLQTHYGGRLHALVLFGSQARGDAEPGSDIDVLVVLPEREQPQDRAYGNQLTYDLLLRYDVMVSLRFVSLACYVTEQSPWMINVRREGIVLVHGEITQLFFACPHGLPERKGNGMTPEQQSLLQKAMDSLRGAQLMATEGLYDIATSRAYYAMFYVAQVFLLQHGLSFSKHSAVISAFGQHVARPGIVPVALHRYLIDGQEARIFADYAVHVMVTEQQAHEWIAHAEEFLHEATRVFGEVG